MEKKLIRVDNRTQDALLTPRDIAKPPVLETRRLGIEFGGLKAVDDFNITIGSTEITGLIGPNGAGKTTIFNLITKVYQPTHGTILLNQKDIHDYNTIQANQAGIARTFQNIRLFNKLSVLDNVMAAMNRDIKYGLFSSLIHGVSYQKAEKEAKEKAMDLLGIFDMQNLAKHEAEAFPTAHRDALRSSAPLPPSPACCSLTSPQPA